MYLLRGIYANGNEYKTVDEIYNSLDPKIDRPEFDRLMRRLKELAYLDEHMTTYKIKVNSIGETNLILIDRQEEEERRRRISETQNLKKRSRYIEIIPQAKRFANSAGIWILNNIIGVVIATLIAAYLIFKFGWNK